VIRPRGPTGPIATGALRSPPPDASHSASSPDLNEATAQAASTPMLGWLQALFRRGQGQPRWALASPTVDLRVHPGGQPGLGRATPVLPDGGPAEQCRTFLVVLVEAPARSRSGRVSTRFVEVQLAQRVSARGSGQCGGKEPAGRRSACRNRPLGDEAQHTSVSRSVSRGAPRASGLQPNVPPRIRKHRERAKRPEHQAGQARREHTGSPAATRSNRGPAAPRGSPTFTR